MDRVTRVPFSEPCLEGMVNLRGSLLTVINGSRWLGRVSHAPAEKILVIQKKKSIIGFAVDQVDGVITVAPEDVLSPEEGSLEQYEGFVMREGTVIRILKVEAVLKPLQNESRPVMPSALSTAVHSLFEPEWSEPRSAPILRFEISGNATGQLMEKVREIAPFPEAAGANSRTAGLHPRFRRLSRRTDVADCRGFPSHARSSSREAEPGDRSRAAGGQWEHSVGVGCGACP